MLTQDLAPRTLVGHVAGRDRRTHRDRDDPRRPQAHRPAVHLPRRLPRTARPAIPRPRMGARRHRGMGTHTPASPQAGQATENQLLEGVDMQKKRRVKTKARQASTGRSAARTRSRTATPTDGRCSGPSHLRPTETHSRRRRRSEPMPSPGSGVARRSGEHRTGSARCEGANRRARLRPSHPREARLPPPCAPQPQVRARPPGRHRRRQGGRARHAHEAEEVRRLDDRGNTVDAEPRDVQGAPEGLRIHEPRSPT